MSDPITIRRAETPDDYRACQEAQRRAWGLADDSYVVPIATMVGVQLHGGLVLGAFLPSGEAVGLSFAFLGRIEGRTCLYSQLTGVVPGHQSLGLGGQLKYAQRDHCRAEGIDLLAWAFDPFQAGNARFNLNRLGATARRYVADMYGPRTDWLNQGVPTDRLIVEWPVDARPRHEPDEDELRFLPRLPTRPGSVPADPDEPESPRVLLEIPPSMAVLMSEHHPDAQTWRIAIRRAFDASFARGYRAVGFSRWRDESGDVGCGYCLELDR